MDNCGTGVPMSGQCANVAVDASTRSWVGGGAGQTVHNHNPKTMANDGARRNQTRLVTMNHNITITINVLPT